MTILLTLLQEGAHVAQEAAQGGHEAGGAAGGPFSINPGLIIWTLVVFGILLVLLWRFAYPSILKSVEDRERRIAKQLEDAERANAEAQRLLEEHKKQIAAARTEAQDILAKAKTLSQKEREALLVKAREEYEALLTRARKDIDDEKDKALLALRREAVELSIAAASRVIEANLDTDANRRLVTSFLEGLEQQQR
jgi:F-type H+-transporting ATPase subunit b